MAHQLIFTSMRRTLIGGSGYGIAAQTPNFPKVLAEELARHSGYSEIYPASDPNQAFNPVNYLHQKAGNWHILGRICHTDNDYSGRSNYLAHYFVLEPSELAPCGPVALLQALPFLDKFEGDSRIITAIQLPKLAASKPKPCAAWRKATGDAGWGGVLAESLSTGQAVGLLYGKNLHGPKALELVGETLALLVPADQWKINFCTHLEGYPKATSCRLKMLQEGCPTARDFRQRTDSWDLAKGSMGQPPGQDWPEYARTGILSLSEHGHANIAELDPADLDSAIESYQAPASFASPAPAMVPPPVVRVLPDEPKADSRFNKQGKPGVEREKSSVAPYLLAGGLSFFTLGIGFLAGYLPQKETVAELNIELEKTQQELKKMGGEKDILGAQLAEKNIILTANEKKLEGQKQDNAIRDDLAKILRKDLEKINKEKMEIQAILDATEQALENEQDAIAKIKTQKDPLNELKNQNLVDPELEKTISGLPESIKKTFHKIININRKARDAELNTEEIIKNTTHKYHLKANLLFPQNANINTGSPVVSPDAMQVIKNVLAKGNGNGDPIPAPKELKELFNGAKSDDRQKSIFWAAQGQGKIPFALNKTTIDLLLDNRDLIEKLYKATIADKAINEIDKIQITNDWKDYSATIKAFVDLKTKINNPNLPPDKNPPPETKKQDKPVKEKEF